MIQPAQTGCVVAHGLFYFLVTGDEMDRQMQFQVLNHSSQYRTNDFWVSGALLASGKKLIKLEWLGPVAIFVFENKIDCDATVEAYFRDDLSVRAKRLNDSLRTLKDRIFSHKRMR
jgi:hypothetical protein